LELKMAEEKINISRMSTEQIEQIIQPGDIIQYEFRAIGIPILRDIQTVIIEQLLENKFNSLEFVSFSIDSERNLLIWKFKIKETTGPALPEQSNIIIALEIAGVTLILGSVLWGTMDGVYKIGQTTQKIIESLAGQTALIGIGSLGIAAAIIGILSIIQKK